MLSLCLCSIYSSLHVTLCLKSLEDWITSLQVFRLSQWSPLCQRIDTWIISLLYVPTLTTIILITCTGLCFILRIGESVSFCLSLFTYIFCYNLKKKKKKCIIYFMYIQYIIKFLSACCYIVFFFCLDDKRCLTNKPAWLNDKWDFPLPGGRSGFFEMKSSVFLLYSHFLSHIISLMMLFFPFLYRIKSAPRVGAELTLNVICLGWQNTPSSLCLISICGHC